jgi:hypothetical protein
MSSTIIRKIVKGQRYRYLNVNGLVPDDWEHVKLILKEIREDKVVIEIDKV